MEYSEKKILVEYYIIIMMTVIEEATIGPSSAKKPFSPWSRKDGSYLAAGLLWRQQESQHCIPVETCWPCRDGVNRDHE